MMRNISEIQLGSKAVFFAAWFHFFYELLAVLSFQFLSNFKHVCATKPRHFLLNQPQNLVISIFSILIKSIPHRHSENLSTLKYRTGYKPTYEFWELLVSSRPGNVAVDKRWNSYYSYYNNLPQIIKIRVNTKNMD